MDFSKDFPSPELELEGAWVDYKEGARLKIARIGNANFNRLYAAKTKPYRRRIEAGTLEPEIENRLQCEVLAKTVLLDWEGVKNHGKNLKYTEKLGVDFLLNVMEFKADVIELAGASQNFFAEMLETDSGN